jgi:rhodanese-related sulfurtransferase
MKHFKTKKNRSGFLATFLFSLSSVVNFAQVTPSLVDFDAYEGLVAEVKEHRKSRLLNAEEFVKTSKEEKVIILDTRSDSMYAAVHVKGAVHLNFSDFTQANLAKIIPSGDYKILIYCNNNFISSPVTNVAQLKVKDFSPYFVTKMAYPRDMKPFVTQYKQVKKSKAKTKVKPGPHVNEFEAIEELPATAKPLTLALNIPTYINLYGYGYKNVYELSELVNTYDDKIEFEGTAVKK